jgi:Tfp pilus assembly protein PilN
MRELEFLPAWYGDLHRHRRRLRLQVWLTVAVISALATWLMLVDRNRRNAEGVVAVLQGQLAQTDSQLKEMDRLTHLEAELRVQEQIQAKLGAHVEAARLIGTLGQIMPASMSLASLGFEVEETPQQLSAMARAALKDPNNVPMDRRLRIKLTGVAPTDVDIASFITELNKVPFFDRVSMQYAKDRRQQGYVMREFELTFSISLDAPAGT